MSSKSSDVRETQIKPVAGIWACDNCGRRIQVVTESETPKRQSFVCVCGAEMRPGEEHAVVGESEKANGVANVVDD